LAYSWHDADEADAVRALGSVVETDRGSLPFALIHGEALVACAAWALGDAGVTAVDLGTPWADVVESGEPFVLHDPLCPMTPAAFIAACVERAVDGDRVVVGVRPAPEGRTTVASPIVLPAAAVASLDDLPTLGFPALVEFLRKRFAVEPVEAPAGADRVASVTVVRALEARTAR
jgi:2-C-methyl-D-erythritol 4-phosphate cytidylyltransferase